MADRQHQHVAAGGRAPGADTAVHARQRPAQRHRDVAAGERPRAPVIEPEARPVQERAELRQAGDPTALAEAPSVRGPAHLHRWRAGLRGVAVEVLGEGGDQRLRGDAGGMTFRRERGRGVAHRRDPVGAPVVAHGIALGVRRGLGAGQRPRVEAELEGCARVVAHQPLLHDQVVAHQAVGDGGGDLHAAGDRAELRVVA